MTTLHYLAYGSNLHPLRLAERVPSARLIGVVPLAGRRLSFHKRSSTDLSAKCDLVETSASSRAFGVLYELSVRHKARLDAIEGLGHGYRETFVDCLLDRIAYRPFTYAAEISHIVPALKPYHWYKALVVTGARYHDFPTAYVNALESIPSIPDPEPERTAANEALLARMAAC